MRRQPRALTQQSFDLVVVGGGIVGACVARDAATRGLSVALIDQQDFSSGTSAASSKMIHGGVRYLAQLQLGVVRESLRERRIWQRIAPHLVRPISFVLPVASLRQRFEGHAGLALFDLLSWDRRQLDDPDQRLLGRTWWSGREAVEQIPLLRGSGVRSAVCYADCQAFSPERLCMECLADAASEGAQVANYVACTGISRTGNAVRGIEARDVLTGEPLSIRARAVVNATGPWADDLLALADGASASARIVRSKGVHIIVRSLSPHYALMLRQHGRHAFVIPWRGHSLIGATDTPYHGEVGDVSPDASDVHTLLDIVNTGLPGAGLTPGDVRFAYAGLRPLVAAGSQASYTMSRRAEIVDHARRGGPAGLVSALGGKWTTARHVAEQCVDVVARRLGAGDRRCTTHERALPGGAVGTLAAFHAHTLAETTQLAPDTVHHLIDLYGAGIAAVTNAAHADAELLKPIAGGVTDIGAQVAFAVREEQAVHLLDVLLRRTGLGTLGAPGGAVVDRVAAIMAGELGWDREAVDWERSQVASYYARASAFDSA